MMKKIKILMGMVICCCTLMVGCGDNSVQEAKDCVDNVLTCFDMVKHYEEMIADSSDADLIKEMKFEKGLNEALMQDYIDEFGEKFAELSPNEQKEVDEYITRTFDERIYNIMFGIE
ncbi:MAG: hypothetical protein K2I22_06065 [Lachnospiraceae bacterium]|nr:hypothetical protein [Lachnospiraceae bacterium]